MGERTCIPDHQVSGRVHEGTFAGEGWKLRWRNPRRGHVGNGEAEETNAPLSGLAGMPAS
ncbi:MAG: hypothetical protein B6U65_00535 [Candidatus Wolframiiraptor sp. EX4484-121]|nr:MAG: hypothetical protein B6U65_00535 [Candidatus Wolframiiraptor sp. EX4484-121]